MLSPDDKKRYARQLIMPEISEAGQEKIRKARILIAGIGGLGSISAYYMTALGVGGIRMVDNDRVDLTNLNRQIMHNTQDIGQPKTLSAEDKLSRLNPESDIEAVHAVITADNAAALANGCDLILDATDNLAARRALNRASVTLGIPFIYGGINGFTGMVSTFYPGKTACFECIFPNGPDTPEKPIGVIGPTAGMVSSLQCIEAVKIILGMDHGLLNKLLRIDGGKMTFKITKLVRNDDCHVCNMERR